MIHHHGDHRGLLTDLSAAEAAEAQGPGENDPDAIVVPSARGAEHLSRAIQIAEYLGRPLVALCSMNTRADDVERFVRAHGVTADVTAIDVSTEQLDLRDLSTTEFLRAEGLLSRVDTSLKRNVGLAVAQLCGWRRVLFLDDDVSVPEPEHLRLAAGLLGPYGAVGLENVGYRDNSVVCHAYRSLPGRAEDQKQFISTMALMVDPVGVLSFFPHLYNEDWLYLIGDDACRTRLAVAGRVEQDAYDPFQPDRAIREELGDIIAEGLFWLLDNAKSTGDPSAEPVGETVWKGADDEFWARYLIMRRELIAMLRDAYTADGRYEQVNALDAAWKESSEITPALCSEYVRRWQDDLYLWRHESDQRTSQRLDLTQAVLTALKSLWHL